MNDVSAANLLFYASNSEDMNLPFLSNIMFLVHSGSSSLHSSSGTSCLCALMELPSFLRNKHKIKSVILASPISNKKKPTSLNSLKSHQNADKK